MKRRVSYIVALSAISVLITATAVYLGFEHASFALGIIIGFTLGMAT